MVLELRRVVDVRLPASSSPDRTPPHAAAFTAASWRDFSCATAATGEPQSAAERPSARQEAIACDSQGAAYHLATAAVTGADVASAHAESSLGQWDVLVHWTHAGQARFTNLSREAFGATSPTNQIAMLVDGVVISVPVIQSVITGDAQITGNFTEEEAKALARKLG